MRQLITLCVTLTFLASCTDEHLWNSDISHITISANDIQTGDEETRTSLAATSTGLSFTWSNNDTVGIYPDQGSQVEFPMAKGAGTKSAVFDGGGWAVKGGHSYSAYYPFSKKNYDNSYSAIPLIYSGQSQTSNNSTTHLGAFDYMVATGSSPSDGKIGFNFTHLNSFLYFQLTSPEPETFTDLTISSEEEIFVHNATVDIFSGKISVAKKSCAISLKLCNIDIPANGVLKAWMAIAPIDMSGKTLVVTVTSSHNSYTATITGKTYLSGKAYQLSSTLVPTRTTGEGKNIGWGTGDNQMLNGHEYVDLGLPSGTLWATCNVGANKPEEFGRYFAWGETKGYGESDTSNSQNYQYSGSDTKLSYSWETYKFCDGSYDVMSKYNNTSNRAFDGKTCLDLSDDAAYIYWGDGWRIPSKAQQEELFNDNFVTTEWITINGIKGKKIKSKKNGNSIFLPSTGQWVENNLQYSNELGGFWSRSLCEDTSLSAMGLYVGSNTTCMNGYTRYWGLPIRPVVDDVIYVTSITLQVSSYDLKIGQSVSLVPTVLPTNATNSSTLWSSSENTVATVADGKINAISEGTSIITVTANDGSGIHSTCVVNVLGYGNSLNGHEFVDLGLPSGTLWATCNVGANSPEEIGNYYAWGETKDKTEYGWYNYKFYNDLKILTKYSNDIDGKTELEPMDDAASTNWGYGWCTPTSEQQKELMNNEYTDMKYTNMNGTSGIKITSKIPGYESESIFIPEGGYNLGGRYTRSIYFWSRNCSGDRAYEFVYSSYSQGYLSSNLREAGLPVRPVRSNSTVYKDTSLIAPDLKNYWNNGCDVTEIGLWTYQITMTNNDPYFSLEALTEDLDKSKTYYLCFEYKSESAHRAELFPSPVYPGFEIWFDIEQTSEWKLIFVPLAEALNRSWGKKGGYLRLDPALEMEADLYMRDIRIIDEAQKEYYEAMSEN